MRVLFVNVGMPFPTVGGGSLRTAHVIEALAYDHDVTLVGFTYGDALPEAPYPLRIVGVPWELPRLYEDMMYGDTEASERASQALASGPFPWRASTVESPAMEQTLRDLARKQFDVAVFEHSSMARFMSALPDTLPKVIDFHNVHTLMERRAAHADGGDFREAERMLAYEADIASRAALCVTCSDAEAAVVREKLGTSRVAVVPNGVDTEYFRPTSGVSITGRLLFTGMMNYPPNIQAVSSFVRTVLPLVRSRVPHAVLDIVGSSPPPDVESLACDHVVVHGSVPDVRPHFDAADVVVVPLLHGGGTRLKILEAAAMGKAIVSTSLGAEGIDLEPDREIVIADTDAQFASAVVSLLHDSGRRTALGVAARTAVAAYDWREIQPRFRALIERLPMDSRAARREHELQR